MVASNGIYPQKSTSKKGAFMENNQTPHKRRVRYSGTHPKRFEEIYKELNPEKYATLQVRVCGWNEYFVKLSKIKQDMFIKQCEVSG